MFKVAVVGHSLVPVAFPPLPGVEVQVFRKPGGKFLDLECREFAGVFSGRFDFLIVFLGGNDLAHQEVPAVLDQEKRFILEASKQTTYLEVCTVEQREYPSSNRFGVSNRDFQTKRGRTIDA